MTIPTLPLPDVGCKRADLHCHSWASNRAAEASLRAIRCPESYSNPRMVHEQAVRRGMDFVTITDHDSLEGVLSIAELPNVLVGEELTCWFPEDGCKMHLLVYGIDRPQHEALQAMARDIYAVAEYIERNRIAHSVAHPIYRQNDLLEKWHVERLLLMFKGFECLNGAHSSLHREAFEPILDRLSRAEIERLSALHGLAPRWPEPWVKSRTAGSDDHGLLNIGRTYTIFPPETRSVEDVLECLRTGRSRAGGEPGSSAKLAHTFYSVAVRYYTNQILTPGRTPNIAALMLQLLAGERKPPGKLEVAKLVLKHQAKKLTRKVKRFFWEPAKPEGTALVRKLFTDSAKARVGDHPELRRALDAGLPPLGEHDEMFRWVSEINRDVTAGIFKSVKDNLGEASFTGMFDSISAVLAQQFMLMPYYFALFHQNKERHLLRQITGQRQGKTDQPLKVALFTDTIDEINGVARFIRDMATQATATGCSLTVHTCTAKPSFTAPWRHNFAPLLTWPMPYYPGLNLNLPPVMEVLEWADRAQFDAVHVSTPGPMGLCGWLVSKMLRVPLLATYHTDFPNYAHALTRDHRIAEGTMAYMKWFYCQATTTFTRSRAYRTDLIDMGVAESRLASITPGINTDTFAARHRDPSVWAKHGVVEPLKLLYVGRISKEKNLAMLATAFRRVCEHRRDAALVLAGDGPFVAELKEMLSGLPHYFLGKLNDAQLGPVYASSDVFVFPSRTDTLGQVVMEAQSCGLPALVGNEGGPRELVDDEVTGLVLPATSTDRWTAGMLELLTDEPKRMRMARTAAQRASRFAIAKSFETFWGAHAAAAEGPISDEELEQIWRRIHFGRTTTA